MTLVVDASVATKWLLPEADSAQAWRVLAERLIAPPLFKLECGNALIRRLRIGQLSEVELAPLLAQVLELPVTSFPVDDRAVLDIAAALRHPVYDCAYLVLAQQLGVRLVTADKRFHNRAASLGVGQGVVLLSDYA